ncbi:MAG: class I SAM-dependent methyltransferase [Thermoleophilia bacterium]
MSATRVPTAATDPVAAFFDRRPRAYDRQLLLERRALRTAAAFAHPVGGLRVIDLAAGTGALAAALLAHGPPPATLTAVDAAPRMLERARVRLGPGATILVADARAVPLPDGSADVVTVGYLLHLLAPGARRAVLAEARRLLTPGGLLVAVVHGSPRGTAGRAYHSAWRLVGRALPGAVIGEGPMRDLAPEIGATGLEVEASRRVAGVYWSQVVRARLPDSGRAHR